MKKINFSKITVALMVLVITALYGCSHVDNRTQAFIDKADAFVSDSMPANALHICTYTDSAKGFVAYIVNDEQGSKYDNEADYYPMLYIYNLKDGTNQAYDLKSSVMSDKKEQLCVSCIKGAKANKDNKEIIIVGTNNNHMGRGLIAIKFNLIKGSFSKICEAIGSKIWIEEGKVGLHEETAAGSAYNFNTTHYDFSGKSVQ
jgi:hypothetical protein